MRAEFSGSEPGWVVCGEALTGRQALAMIQELSPDLVVLDVALPELNGIEVARPGYAYRSSVQILMVTGHDSKIKVVHEAVWPEACATAGPQGRSGPRTAGERGEGDPWRAANSSRTRWVA